MTEDRIYVRWGRSRNSWHIVEPYDVWETICGRLIVEPAENRDSLPAARSCVSCLRIARRRENAAPA